MDLVFVGELLRVLGEVMVVLAVLHMHSTMVEEHKIDRRVVLTFRQERVLTWTGLLSIVIGFALEIHGELLLSWL